MLSKFNRRAGSAKKQGKYASSAGSEPLRDYSKEPFFIKKAEASKAILAKYGYPAQLVIKN